jgi:putative spermidine/putrescine transport system permease protein
VRQVDDPRPWRLLLIVPLVVSLLLFAVPQYFFISTSFHENLGYGKFSEAFTLVNYHRIFTDSLYLAALWRTLVLSALTALFCLVLGFPVAYVLARAQSRWTSFLLGLLVAATFITPVVKDLGLIILLSQGGTVNAVLGALGLIASPVRWLGSETGVVIGLVHYTLPLIVLLLHTVIQTVPRSLEDAAHVHGASRLRVFTGVIIPIVMPGMVAAALMVFNLAAGAFTSPAILGGGRVLTMSMLIQRSVILDVDYPFAAALSTILLLFVFTLNLVSGYLMVKQSSGRGIRKKKKSVSAADAGQALRLKGV